MIRKWYGSGTEVVRKWYGSGTEVVRKWYVGASRSQWELVGASDFVSLVLAKTNSFAGTRLTCLKQWWPK